MDQKALTREIKTALDQADHPGPPMINGYRKTSVMALFLADPAPELLFIQKADRKGYPWRNQMAFPGGHLDKADPNALAAAFREVEEELGIRPKNVDTMGSLGHFQTINNTSIHAFAGFWNRQDRIDFDTREISRVITIPLGYLQNLHKEKNYHRTVPHIMDLTYPFEDVVIWGATAKILYHLLEILIKTNP